MPRTLPTPRPRDGELLLALDLCGLCGTDLFKIAAGSHRGRVLGHELVGTVAAIGHGVSRFEIGQRVVSPHHVACNACRRCRLGATTRCAAFQQEQLEPGGFCEWIVVREPAVRLAARPIPSVLSSEAAVFLEPAACVLRGIDRSGLGAVAKASSRVAAVVLGGGSMGLLHLLVLRCLLPEATVIVSEPLEERRDTALRLGATAAVAPERLESLVRTELEDGADAVFDTVGDPRLLEAGLTLLREGGTLVLFAHFAEGSVGAVHEPLFHEEKRIVGTYSGAIDEQDRVFDWLCSGTLRPESLITHRLPLSRMSEAVELARSRSALKILMVPG